MNIASNPIDSSTHNNSAEYSLIAEKAKFSSKLDFLENLSFLHNNESLTLRYTPNAIWDMLDFGLECPSIIDVVNRFPFFGNSAVQTINDFHDLRGLQRPYNTNIYADYGEQIGLGCASVFEMRYFHNLDEYQLKTRQIFIELQQSNNPLNLMNNDLKNRVTRVLPLFSNRLPDTQVTTYHFQFLYHVLVGSKAENTAGGVAYHSIGLYTLCDALTQPNNYNYLAPYYPIVWDYFANNDAVHGVDQLAEWIHNRHGKEALFVFLDPSHVAMQLRNHATIAQATNIDMSRIWDLMKYTTHIDRQMMLLYSSLYLSQAGSEGWANHYIPHYDFFNHILDIFAMNFNPQPWSGLTPNWLSKPSHTYSLLAVSTLMFQRLCDYTGQAHHTFMHRLPSGFLTTLFWLRTNEGSPVSYASRRWFSRFWMPYEYLYFINGKPPLAPFYVLADFHQIHVIINAAGQTFPPRVSERKRQDQRIYFQPSYIVKQAEAADYGPIWRTVNPGKDDAYYPFAEYQWAANVAARPPQCSMFTFYDAGAQWWIAIPATDTIENFHTGGQLYNDEALKVASSVYMLVYSNQGYYVYKPLHNDFWVTDTHTSYITTESRFKDFFQM